MHKNNRVQADDDPILFVSCLKYLLPKLLHTS